MSDNIKEEGIKKRTIRRSWTMLEYMDVEIPLSPKEIKIITLVAKGEPRKNIESMLHCGGLGGNTHRLTKKIQKYTGINVCGNVLFTHIALGSGLVRYLQSEDEDDL